MVNVFTSAMWVPLVLWRCWLGGRKGIRPVKNWVVGCWRVVIWLERGADLHMAQLMTMPLTVSCFSKIQIGFTFLVLAHPGSPGQRAIKRVSLSSAMWLLSCGRPAWVWLYLQPWRQLHQRVKRGLYRGWLLAILTALCDCLTWTVLKWHSKCTRTHQPPPPSASLLMVKFTRIALFWSFFSVMVNGEYQVTILRMLSLHH